MSDSIQDVLNRMTNLSKQLDKEIHDCLDKIKETKQMLGR